MEITTPSIDDVDAIVDRWVALAREQCTFDSHVRPEANRSVITESVSRHVVAGGLLVARADGEMVGFVQFDVEDGVFEQDVTRGLVRNIYVDPAHRGEGIGGALLAGAEDRLVERGADVVALEVLADNEDARRFYRECGYEPHRLELEKSPGSDTL